MTYSIVARDPITHELGVAVQTCNLAVGTWVPWAEGGVGAVATQSMAERSYGTLGLDLMRGGMAAPEALAALLAVDEQRDLRQIAMVDGEGRLAQHNGLRCLPEAGMAGGEGFSTQANMMVRDTVWGAMAEAYEQAPGDIAERMLAALDAAEGEGGDIRGQQTAALLVVGPERSPIPLIDLRVDHHPQPLWELRRLLRLHRAYDGEYAITDLVARGEEEKAYELVQKVLEWAPGEDYLRYLCAIHLAGGLNRREEALPLLRPLIAERPMWLEYLRRDAAANLFGPPGTSAALYRMLQEETS